MTLSNFERLVQLADEVFAVKSDPSQLDVNPEVLERLQQMHSATVSAFDDGNGPVAWVLLIPTTIDLMKRFLGNQITEKELFNLTPLNSVYDAIYLCSALVLEEYRRKGITKNLAMSAIEIIRKDNPLKAAFVWTFSPEGDLAAETIAKLAGLPLYKRVNKID
jgi:GNAT superfamily N-acetyltransferase